MSLKRVLTIATSSAPILNGKRSGLYLSELTHFLALVDQAGLAYDIASPRGGAIPLDENSITRRQLADPANVHFMGRPAFAAALRESQPCAEVDPSRYDALFLAGGHGTMWDFRQTDAVQGLITALYDAGGFVTGVCHGVSGFVDALDGHGRVIVRGKRVTGFTNLEDTIARTKHAMPFLLEDALDANGAHFKKNLIPFTSRVEVDGRVITGQNPQSAKAVGEALVARLL